MKVSIIILTYNHERYIIDCLNTVKHQSITYNHKNMHSIQVVVADDCSSDSTVQAVNRWKEQNDKFFQEFVVIENEKNLGTCLNYINALNKCTGDYIKAIGGDDMLAESSIFRIFHYLDYYDIVFGVPFVYYENGNNDIEETLKVLQKTYCIQKEESKIKYYDLIHRYCFINGPASYISKKLLTDKRVIEFLGTFKYIDDYPQWLKMAEIKDIKFTSIPIISVIYRRTNGSAYIVKNQELLDERIRSYKYAYTTCKSVIGRVLLRNTLSILKNTKGKSSRYKDLRRYLNELYWLKNIFTQNPFQRELVEYTMEFIENIKAEKV